MWQKKLKKTVYTLNLNPDVYKPVTDLTYPLIKEYARKIGADFHIISERKFPEWKSPTYEKCQVYELAQKHGNDWNIFIDSDAVVHPDLMDITELLDKDTVFHNGCDFAPIRWHYDRFFQRDSRHIGSPSWLCIASDWCIELFKPIDDMTPDETYENIFPTVGEQLAGYEPYRLIEDYVFSRNIAKYGLKFMDMGKIFDKHSCARGDFLWHQYAMPIEEKVIKMREVMKNWRLI